MQQVSLSPSFPASLQDLADYGLCFIVRFLYVDRFRKCLFEI